MLIRCLLVFALLVPVSFPVQAKSHRSAAARRAFERTHPCPATHAPKGACPGYIVDHVIALACGGPDVPSNMQWQTVAEAKAKDKVERKGCR